MLDNRKILADNLTRLLATRDESRLSLSRKIGVADGSLGRIKYGTGNPTLEALENIAKFFRLEVWHLFVPDLDPKNPPPLPGNKSDAQDWPFQRIDIRSVNSLSELDKAYIEGRLAEAISTAGISQKAVNQ
ncbi:helix-turn-helix domain-containing protein [Neopusillimonas aromaticivorans]|uniref:helix-turn-helix domain-containing protein n=1 Tax=Neopusillimonas aromaticivorans TaxID=2979868 RepID=UPI0025920465|nr:helix-turn-helix transcriptional regulator [Neopusillimonas aromaticivorans]NLZ10864.1 helix-turn-helix transcriptional regulator [Alcaligenaceae bacterium]WJJ93420.1 helix-turn-helix transcriptional regulator [Neopusillimonas aromaticivorans]